MESALSRKRKSPDDAIGETAGAAAPTAKPFSVPCNIKNAACARWRPALRLAEVVRMKGNFWHRYGFSKNGCNYLHPEEALMLVERGQVYIEDDGGSPVPSSVFYEMMISEISLPVYLAFLKLRALEYIILRSGQEVRELTGEELLIEIDKSDADEPLLTRAASFQIYRSTNWSKRNASMETPSGIVVVILTMHCRTEDSLPGPRAFLKLLDACNDTPLIFAVVMPSGFVCIQEFSDALTSISWNPVQPAAVTAPKNEATEAVSLAPQSPDISVEGADRAEGVAADGESEESSAVPETERIAEENNNLCFDV